MTHWEPADIQTTWVVFCTSTYRIPKSCGLVLDLGANIGTFSILAAKIMGAERIIALEPVSKTFDKLRCNIENNGLASRVVTMRKGIGGSTGPRTIHLGVSSPHSSMYYRNDPRFESGRTEEIEVISLDQLFEDLGIETSIFARWIVKAGRWSTPCRVGRRATAHSSPYYGISFPSEPFGRNDLFPQAFASGIPLRGE